MKTIRPALEGISGGKVGLGFIQRSGHPVEVEVEMKGSRSYRYSRCHHGGGHVLRRERPVLIIPSAGGQHLELNAIGPV